MAEQNEELEALRQSVAKLEDNNKRLTAELKTARKNAEITPEQMAEVEAERDKYKDELTNAQKLAKDAQKAAETATKALEQESGFTQKLLIDNGLVSELTKHGVTNPAHLKAAQALLRGEVKIIADGENRIAKVGDKALADYVKEWATGDDGKHFVAAPANSGGGANGAGNGSGGTKTVSRAEFDAMQHGDRAAFAKSGGKVVN